MGSGGLTSHHHPISATSKPHPHLANPHAIRSYPGVSRTSGWRLGSGFCCLDLANEGLVWEGATLGSGFVFVLLGCLVQERGFNWVDCQVKLLWNVLCDLVPQMDVDSLSDAFGNSSYFLRVWHTTGLSGIFSFWATKWGKTSKEQPTHHTSKTEGSTSTCMHKRLDHLRHHEVCFSRIFSDNHHATDYRA